jgi:hypothetical protein
VSQALRIVEMAETAAALSFEGDALKQQLLSARELLSTLCMLLHGADAGVLRVTASACVVVLQQSGQQPARRARVARFTSQLWTRSWHRSRGSR